MSIPLDVPAIGETRIYAVPDNGRACFRLAQPFSRPLRSIEVRVVSDRYVDARS